MIGILLNVVHFHSLRSRRLEVVGIRKNGRGVSPSRAPVLSFAHNFQAPATQASTFRSTKTYNKGV